MAKPMIADGTYTGTGAAINLELGFVPSYFLTINITDGAAGLEWFAGMDAGTAVHPFTGASITSNGVTVYNGTRGGNAAGVTVGTTGSTDTKVFRYVAMRGGA
jgi:hypothetical protein